MARATAPLLKDLNQRTVLEAIRAGAPISRAEISRRAGVSKPTVSLALQALLHAGNDTYLFANGFAIAIRRA